MTLEEKQSALKTLGEAFQNLINVVVPMVCGGVQKNQAILRFDEGHMWMQNAIMTYQLPQAPESPVVNELSNENQKDENK